MGNEKEIAEIEGMLNAYRQGWVQYDRKHAQELKARLEELRK